MRRLGIIGGMSWESTARYYELINRGVYAALGGLRSAPLLIESLDFAEVEEAHQREGIEALSKLFAACARKLEAGGAEAILMTSNTMHKASPAIESAISVPFLHIADPTGHAARRLGVRTVGLLGTRYTMQQRFYRRRLEEMFDLEVRIPESSDIETVHRIIYEELCRGVIAPESRRHYLETAARLTASGAEALILGCTEIGLLIGPEHLSTPLIDTTVEHAAHAVRWILGSDGDGCELSFEEKRSH